MRRFTIGSAMVLALLLTLTAVAVAAPSFCDPANPRYDLDNKLCTTTTTSDPTTTSTTTTTVPEPSTLDPCPTEKVIEVLKPGRVSYQCLWTPAVVDGSPAGKVTVTVDNGEIGGLAIFVLDSMPGNVCELVQINKPTEQESASFDLVDGQDTYWNTGGTNWCARYDEFGPKDDLNGPPLHVRVLFRAKGDTAVTISLTPEQAAVSG